MGHDKEGSKGGGYVGGFFHLFDWKAKSRKKLFSSKSDVPGTGLWDWWLVSYTNILYLSCFLHANVIIISSPTLSSAEHSKQGKKSDGNLPTTRVYLV